MSCDNVDNRLVQELRARWIRKLLNDDQALAVYGSSVANRIQAPNMRAAAVMALVVLTHKLTQPTNDN